MKKFLVILTLITLLLPVVILADEIDPLRNELPPDITPLWLIQRLATLVYWVLLAASILVIVYAAFLFVTAAGKEEQIEKARNMILYAIIGIVVAFVAYGLRSFLLENIVG